MVRRDGGIGYGSRAVRPETHILFVVRGFLTLTNPNLVVFSVLSGTPSVSQGRMAVSGMCASL